MELLKRNAFFIVCGIVGAGSIALSVMGVKAMASVKQGMQDAAGLYDDLSRFGRRDPANQAVIDAAQDRIDDIAKNYHRVLAWAFERNRWAPLMPDVFPSCGPDAKLEFRTRYQEARLALLSKLRAGGPPTDAEVELARTQMTEQLADLQRSEGTDSTSEEDEPPKYTLGNIITDHAAFRSPETRAAIRKARAVYCYAGEEALEYVANIEEGLTPAIETMWDAQLSLWIQQDVIAALARVNEQAAERIQASDGHPWVGVLPVKDLVSIRTSRYVLDDSVPGPDAMPVGNDPALPPGSADFVFTDHRSDELYEVVQFTLKMVVDVRDLPTIIDEICKDRFHTLLRVSYRAITGFETNYKMEGKIYGEEPAVRVVMDFETCLFGDIYRRLMPDTILDEIGRERPEVSEEDTSDET